MSIEAIRAALDRLDNAYGVSERIWYSDELADACNPSAIKELLDRLEAAENAVQWQPIETAPKDGTRLLLWWGSEVHIGRCVVAGMSRDGGDWWRSESHQVFKVAEGRPTHWMPLPAAPAAMEGE